MQAERDTAAKQLQQERESLKAEGDLTASPFFFLCRLSFSSFFIPLCTCVQEKIERLSKNGRDRRSLSFPSFLNVFPSFLS